FSLLWWSPLQASLLPYTTLFRSLCRCSHPIRVRVGGENHIGTDALAGFHGERHGVFFFRVGVHHRWKVAVRSSLLVDHVYVGKRSEEHTSELQSRENIVCRLLLE